MNILLKPKPSLSAPPANSRPRSEVSNFALHSPRRLADSLKKPDFHSVAVIQGCARPMSDLAFNNMGRPIAVDLFAGAGGLSLGFQQAGFDVRAAVEYDPIHCAVHEFNFPNCGTICRSVTDIDGDYIRSHSSI